ncbi:MAG: LemA family protein [Nonlabens sp.]
MKKLGIGGILLIIGIILLIFGWSWYNSTIGLKENVTSQWANVESSYQRRNDLIPNIVATAKQYAEFEQETLNNVIKARANATSINIDASDLTPEKIAAFSQAQSAVSSGLGRLLATYENYPNLKANENFKELINELERTENRINVERNRFNETARGYNTKIKKLPGALFAGILGFDEEPYFKAEEGSEQAPDVGNLFE